MREQNDDWECIGVYVDDLLIMSRDTATIIKALEKEYTLKGVGIPKYYLGTDMQMLDKPERVFTLGSATYIKCCLAIYEQIYKEQLPRKIDAPLDPKDHPELDDTDLLDKAGMCLYWKLLGMLQWAVTLGRIDIMCAVMTMGGYRCQPRIGHMNRLKRIFGFLKQYSHAPLSSGPKKQIIPSTSLKT
jgi:hypothetical protein